MQKNFVERTVLFFLYHTYSFTSKIVANKLMNTLYACIRVASRLHCMGVICSIIEYCLF